MVEQTTRLRVTQVKSGIGYHYTQKATLRTLGFRRLYQTVEVVDTPSVRGMLRKVAHLVRVDEPAAPRAEANDANA
ncbi:MAG: 50S ribosomal protein L30 [Chloroflexi bacterium]|nr:50S ribosomal protein L30 [Chloroflexota bacterium]